ncbi:GNAT family N-acetyltransferase [Chryseobacterium sp.]|uniref:GNAT family N-acetyltransferase n=1 Tax=Chryseobacterium sp. TaxID=1871047 RepID=UPI0028A26820|nr:GNAT family N-acetyltransferase [Chryseobacterium sp.]
MNSYKALSKQIYSQGEYSIVPIRFQDRHDIMKWRNEQIYHLRQNKVLTIEDQDYYFDNIVSKLFDLDQPDQVLFSFLYNDICIGYGGLVHINWIDKHAEISFIMNTQFEKDYFDKYWSIFLKLIEELAFENIKLHKISTFAFDLRPHLYIMLEKNFYLLDAVLKEHILFNNKYIDVVMHYKLNAYE